MNKIREEKKIIIKKFLTLTGTGGKLSDKSKKSEKSCCNLADKKEKVKRILNLFCFMKGRKANGKEKY